MSAWRSIVSKYQNSSAWRASWQLFNTVVSYTIVWILMYFALQVSWLLTIPLVVLGAGLLVRTFIIFHDCGHGSFFTSKRINDTCGIFCGILTFTPYYHWRWQHSIHHASSGNLDRRGTGDIWTMTVREYLESSRWKRFAYRLTRNPVILFVIAPLYLFLVHNRLHSPDAKRKEKYSVWLTNAALLGITVLGAKIFGIIPFIVLQLFVLTLAGSAGIWLFYVQHQYENVYWERNGEWHYVDAALKGSSFYKLPKVFQWFSGNIGFHHIHHLSPKIPNYNLEKCHKSEPLFQAVKPLTLFESFKSVSLHLWDESAQKLVGFKYLRNLR